MRAVFVDTSYYAAILNRRDQWHERARIASASVFPQMITTEFVLLEVANFCSAGVGRDKFVHLIRSLRSNSQVEIVSANPTDFESGFTLFESRADKHWSLTDCISFSIMSTRSIIDALTADEHFEQAGFNALLRNTL